MNLENSLFNFLNEKAIEKLDLIQLDVLYDDIIQKIVDLDKNLSDKSFNEIQNILKVVIRDMVGIGEVFFGDYLLEYSEVNNE